MNEFRIRATGAVVTEPEYRAMYPNVAFPAVLKPADADPVLAAPAPAVGKYQTAMRDGVRLDSLGNWVHKWLVQNWTQAEIEAHEAAQAAVARQAAKAARADKVAAITVAVGNKVFDGDEKSQTRMARAILALQAAGVGTTPWTLADDTNVDVTLSELQGALVKAGLAQSAVWPL